MFSDKVNDIAFRFHDVDRRTVGVVFMCKVETLETLSNDGTYIRLREKGLIHKEIFRWSEELFEVKIILDSSSVKRHLFERVEMMRVLRSLPLSQAVFYGNNTTSYGRWFVSVSEFPENGKPSIKTFGFCDVTSIYSFLRDYQKSNKHTVTEHTTDGSSILYEVYDVGDKEKELELESKLEILIETVDEPVKEAVKKEIEDRDAFASLMSSVKWFNDRNFIPTVPRNNQVLKLVEYESEIADRINDTLNKKALDCAFVASHEDLTTYHDLIEVGELCELIQTRWEVNFRYLCVVTVFEDKGVAIITYTVESGEDRYLYIYSDGLVVGSEFIFLPEDRELIEWTVQELGKKVKKKLPKSYVFKQVDK